MLYALSAADLTMLVALVFVLARNIVKLVVERRRGSAVRAVPREAGGLLLGMTLVPAVLVLLVGSELIRNSVDRWFNAPMDESCRRPAISPATTTRNGSVSSLRKAGDWPVPCLPSI